MARRKKDAPIDLADSHDLSVGLIDALVCPPGKMQAFLRDKKTPGLRVRVTAAGAKSYVFEGKLNRQTIRQTIGDVRAWTIERAQQEANRLRVLLDRGTDPRELQREREAAKAAKEAEAAEHALTVADVWPRYMAEGKPKRRTAWKPRYVADLHKAASMGGEPKKRGKGTTKPGHLAALMPMALASIDQDAVRDWYAREAKTAPIQAARVGGSENPRKDGFQSAPLPCVGFGSIGRCRFVGVTGAQPVSGRRSERHVAVVDVARCVGLSG